MEALEEKMKELTEQINAVKNQLDNQSKIQEGTNDFIRPPVNPAMILDQDNNFDVWYRMIVGELTTLKREIYLREPTEKDGTVNYNPEDEEVKVKLNFVSTFLLARVNDEFKNSICEYKLPYEMLEKIREMRFPNLLSGNMMLERQWNNITMSDAETVLQFTNRFQNATNKLIACGIKLEDQKIVGNYGIAMKVRFPECCRRFDADNNISFAAMKKLALGIESTEKESKVRTEEGSGSVCITPSGSAAFAVTTEGTCVNSEEKREVPRKTKIICFRCSKPNHTAAQCTNPKQRCYNCGKLGSHTARECTAPPISFPSTAKFPSGRTTQMKVGRGIRAGGRIRGSAPSFGFRGRGFGRGARGSSGSSGSYRKVKMTGMDGKEKYVMFSDVDGKIYELPEETRDDVDCEYNNEGDKWQTYE